MAASTLEVLITGNSLGLTSALAKAAASAKAFETQATSSATSSQKAFSGVSSSLKSLSPAFIAVGALALAGIAKGIEATQEWAGEVRTLQRVTGQSAESASALVAAGEHLGISVQQLTVGFGLLSKNIINATPNLTKYGIAVRDASGGLLPFDQVLGAVSDKFATLPAGPEQAAFAMNVFGRSGKALIPILQRGSEGLQEFYDDAKAAGLIMSQQDLEASKQLTLAQRGLSEAFKGASISIGNAFVPALTTLTKALTFTVNLFERIPAPLKTATFGFAALTGTIAALQFVGGFFANTWRGVLSTLGLTSAAGAAAGEGIGVAGATAGATVAPIAALAESVTALVAALQAQAGVAVEASAALAGYGRTASGLIVPEQALAASTAETNVALGAKSGKGLLGGLASIGPLGLVAAAGVGIIAGELILFRNDARAAHEEFEKGIGADLTLLAQGGRSARQVRLLAQTPFITTNPATTTPLQPLPGGSRGQGAATAAILAQNTAIAQASAALAEYRHQQELADTSTAGLARSLDGLISPAQFATTAIADIAGASDILNAGISSMSGAFHQFSEITGQDTSSILSNLDKVVNDSKSTPQQVAEAYTGALAQMRAANQAWHDDLVAAFGGAGGALEEFANKSNVNLGNATSALQDYTDDIERFGSNIATIQDRFGKDASAFINWASSQGLAQQGLVAAVADSNGKMAQSFITNFNKADSATNSLATAIQQALDPVFNRIIHWLQRVVSAITGVPILKIKVDANEAFRKIDGIHHSILALPHHTILDIKTNVHGSDLPDEVLRKHLFDPLKRGGFVKVGNRWTLPLDVGVRTATNDALGNVHGGLGKRPGDQPKPWGTDWWFDFAMQDVPRLPRTHGLDIDPVPRGGRGARQRRDLNITVDISRERLDKEGAYRETYNGYD